MNVDYRLLPRFEASWALAEAARAARRPSVPPRDRLFADEARWQIERLPSAAAVAVTRWLEDDR